MLHRRPLEHAAYQLQFGSPGTHLSEPGLLGGGRRRSIPVPVRHRHNGPSTGGEQAAASLRLTQRRSCVRREVVWPIHLQSAVSYDGLMKRTQTAIALRVGKVARPGCRISEPEQSAVHAASSQKMHQC